MPSFFGLDGHQCNRKTRGLSDNKLEIIQCIIGQCCLSSKDRKINGISTIKFNFIILYNVIVFHSNKKRLFL
jgi:hypothetical protein